jgi:hypothetical protein
VVVAADGFHGIRPTLRGLDAATAAVVDLSRTTVVSSRA